jgi:hypothetical protein
MTAVGQGAHTHLAANADDERHGVDGAPLDSGDAVPGIPIRTPFVLPLVPARRSHQDHEGGEGEGVRNS